MKIKATEQQITQICKEIFSEFAEFYACLFGYIPQSSTHFWRSSHEIGSDDKVSRSITLKIDGFVLFNADSFDSEDVWHTDLESERIIGIIKNCGCEVIEE